MPTTLQAPHSTHQLAHSPIRTPRKALPLQLRGGSAEIFGTSLDLGDRLTLCGVKVAVFTWEGAELELEGEPDIMWVRILLSNSGISFLVFTWEGAELELEGEPDIMRVWALLFL